VRPRLVIDPLSQHRDLIELTVDWHLSEFDVGGDRRAWLALAIEVLRSAGTRRVSCVTGFPQRTARRLFSSGRTSRERWIQYAKAATQIATEDLASWDKALPATDEACWRLHLRERDHRLRCKCGTPLTGRQRKWCAACRLLSGVKRRAGPDGGE
jgi:hypothetical protein